MGIDGLRKFVRENVPGAIETGEITSMMTGKLIGVDTSIYLYRMKSQGRLEGGFKSLLGIMEKAGATPVFVLDGKPIKAKQRCIKERKAKKVEAGERVESVVAELAALRAGEPEDVDEMVEWQRKLAETEKQLATLQRANVSLEKTDVETVLEMIRERGQEIRAAEREADFLLAEMARAGEIDVVLSEDMDMLAHGCPRLLRLGEGSWRTVELFHLDRVLEGLDLSVERFSAFCVMCGCDQCSRVKGIGPVRAMGIVKSLSGSGGGAEAGGGGGGETIVDEVLQRIRTAWRGVTDEEQEAQTNDFRTAMDIFA